MAEFILVHVVIELEGVDVGAPGPAIPYRVHAVLSRISIEVLHRRLFIRQAFGEAFFEVGIPQDSDDLKILRLGLAHQEDGDIEDGLGQIGVVQVAPGKVRIHGGDDVRLLAGVRELCFPDKLEFQSGEFADARKDVGDDAVDGVAAKVLDREPVRGKRDAQRAARGQERVEVFPFALAQRKAAIGSGIEVFGSQCLLIARMEILDLRNGVIKLLHEAGIVFVADEVNAL